MKHLLSVIVIGLFAAGCGSPPEAVLGTLERDRISLPAPVFERIADIPVREGATVAAGDVIVQLEATRTEARLAAALADVARLESALAEAHVGPRRESIAQARAQLERAKSIAINARRDLERIQAIVEQRLLPMAELDRALATTQAAEADVAGARAALELLENGTRIEQIAQAESALAAARSQAAALAVDLERTRITAPRAGVVDSLPFKTGDQVGVGTTLATLLVGEVPYARVYVPQPLRARIAIGTAATVFVQGDDTPYPARVRAIRHEPGFTPYYALSGEDAARLSYLAEVEIDTAAAMLPVGLPVRVTFAPETP